MPKLAKSNSRAIVFLAHTGMHIARIKGMDRRDLTKLPAFVKGSTNLNVVVESPRGTSVKLDYNAESDAFELSYVLPTGSIFPFDFGFVPSTVAEDGDPLDILVLLDVPTCVGCVLTAKPIGVIEAEQSQDGKTFRNDRLIGVAIADQQRASLSSLTEMNPHVLEEIELFFSSYNKMRGRKFRAIHRAGSNTAIELVRRAMQRFAASKSS
jgi:inorganic pyrophosphatase